MQSVEDLLVSILNGLVKNPDKIELNTTKTSDDKGELSIITVKVASEDIGICIGEKGATAEAIRRIIGLVGYRKIGERVFVRIDAPKSYNTYEKIYGEKNF